MLDLETWGTRPGSALRSVGACVFDPYSDYIGGMFYRNITDESCVHHALLFDENTIKWWKQQDHAAQRALLVNQRPLGDVMDDFHDWFRYVSGVFVWGHGASFDEPLWTEAARRLDKKVPWKFWDTRCTRTIFDVAGVNIKNLRRPGVHHNALDDALFQARCVQLAYRKLKTNWGVEE
jgi:hypothetical protein